MRTEEMVWQMGMSVAVCLVEGKQKGREADDEHEAEEN